MNLTAPAPHIQTGFTLDPALLARRRRDSARRIHTVQIPAIRAIGFTVLCLIALLQDLRSSGTVDWMQLNRLVAINLLYAAISWMVLRRFYGRTGQLDMSVVFFHLDVLVWLPNLHHLEQAHCSSPTSC